MRFVLTEVSTLYAARKFPKIGSVTVPLNTNLPSVTTALS